MNGGIQMQKITEEEKVCRLAEQLMWSGETPEDMRAVRNILILKDLLLRKEDSFFDFGQVDARVRREYPLIGLLEREKKQSGAGQELRSRRLRADIRGIYADVLLKHRYIQCLKKFADIAVSGVDSGGSCQESVEEFMR